MFQLLLDLYEKQDLKQSITSNDMITYQKKKKGSHIIIIGTNKKV